MPRFIRAVLVLLLLQLSVADSRALVRFDFEQKFFTEPGQVVKDHAVVRKDGVYHLYYLRGNPAVSIGHATSTDLAHWTVQTPILYRDPGDWDGRALWAPHAIPYGSGYIMLYTGVNDNNCQQVGFASSSELWYWFKAPAPWNPVYHPDTTWAEWSEDTWSHCRDPFVFFDLEGNLYMLNTAKTKTNRGAIACARANDLNNLGEWEDIGPLYVHDSWHVLESVQCMYKNNKWHLFYTEETVGGTTHMSSDSLFSGWDPATAIVIDYGAAPEINEFDPGKYIFSRHAVYNDGYGNSFFVIRFDSLRWSGDYPYTFKPWALTEKWNIVWGGAFLQQPTFGNNPGARGENIDVGHQGLCWLSSYERYTGPLGIGSPGGINGDFAVGLIRSDAFQITGNSMSLLVGGNLRPADCWVALRDANTQEILRAETGKETDEMDRRYWDLQPFKYREVYIEIMDNSDNGHISCDDIVESDSVIVVPNPEPDHDRPAILGHRDKYLKPFRPWLGGDSDIPSAPVLYQNIPNPFNPVTTIEFALPREAHVTLTVFDVAGRHVRTLVDQSAAPGIHRVTWDGRDTTSKPLPSGTYFYRLQQDGKTIDTRKMILLR